MTPGDSVVVAIGTNGAAISSVTDSKGNTYVIDKQANNSTISRAAIATCVNPTPLVSGDTVTLHLGVAAAFCYFSVSEYLRLAAPDQTGNNTGTGTSGSVTTAGATSTATEVAIVSWSLATSSAGAAATSPFTLRNTITSQGHIQDNDLAATGTITGSFTWTASRSWVAVIVTYTLAPPQTLSVPFISSVTTLYTPTLIGNVSVPFISSVTALYTPTLTAAANEVDVPFIASATVVYDLTIPTVPVPFIASATQVYALGFSTIPLPFIASATVVYALTVSRTEVDVPFIASHTVLYEITFHRVDMTQVALELVLSNAAGDAMLTQVALELLRPVTGVHVWGTSGKGFA